MASIINSYALEAGRNTFPVSFEYLARRFVKVTLVGSVRQELVLNVDYRFTSKMEIETTVNWAPGLYQTIEIKRVTSATDRLVNFTDGSILRSQDLNIAQIQAIHIAEEARAVADDAMSGASGAAFDARGLRITNVGDPTQPTDTANKRWTEALVETTRSRLAGYIDESIAAVQGGFGSFMQNLVGAVTRTFNSKMADIISIKDFGAIGDGVFHALSERFITQALAQAAYPNVPGLTLIDSIDYAAIAQADFEAARVGKSLRLDAGVYFITKTIKRRAMKWYGEGTTDAWKTSTDRSGTILIPHGPGNPMKWTDINTTDTSLRNPMIVPVKSGMYTEGMTLLCVAAYGRWSAGLHFPGTRRNTVRNVDALGEWTDAGIYGDATWSSSNTTLTSLHPDVPSDSGLNEYVIDNCFVTGLHGLRIQGTTRDKSTRPFVWAPGGTSDWTIASCRLGSDGPEAERLESGCGFWHDAVINNSAGSGQGINFINTTIRVAAKYGMVLDHSNRIMMTNTYSETISSWVTKYGQAINAMTSNTSIVSMMNDANGLRWYKDGVIAGNDASINQWQTTRVINKWRSDGAIASPHFYASFESATGLLLTSFSENGLITFRHDTAGAATPYLHLTNSGFRPEKAGGMNMGTGTFFMGVGTFSELRAVNALRPTVGNSIPCGPQTHPWSGGFTQSAFTVTSDERLKTFTDHVTDDVLDVWENIDWRSWKFNDRMQEKGSDARIHFGLGAQTLVKAFEDAGIDPFKYAIVCYDTWKDEYEEVDGEMVLTLPAGDRYGLRYEEALCLDAALRKRTAERHEARIAALEELVKELIEK